MAWDASSTVAFLRQPVVSRTPGEPKTDARMPDGEDHSSLRRRNDAVEHSRYVRCRRDDLDAFLIESFRTVDGFPGGDSVGGFEEERGVVRSFLFRKKKWSCVESVSVSCYGSQGVRTDLRRDTQERVRNQELSEEREVGGAARLARQLGPEQGTRKVYDGVEISSLSDNCWDVAGYSSFDKAFGSKVQVAEVLALSLVVAGEVDPVSTVYLSLDKSPATEVSTRRTRRQESSRCKNPATKVDGAVHWLALGEEVVLPGYDLPRRGVDEEILPAKLARQARQSAQRENLREGGTRTEPSGQAREQLVKRVMLILCRLGGGEGQEESAAVRLDSINESTLSWARVGGSAVFGENGERRAALPDHKLQRLGA